jgi:hypothetical protein
MGNTVNPAASPVMPEEVRRACMGKFHRSIGELVMRFCRLDRRSLSAVVRFRGDTERLLAEMRGAPVCNPLDIDALEYLLVQSTPPVAAGADVPVPADDHADDEGWWSGSGGDISEEEMEWQGIGGARSGIKR